MIRHLAAIVGLVGLGLAAMLAGDDSNAQQPQVPYSTACQTNMGICPIAPAPFNSACRCFNDPGRVVPPPQQGQGWNNVCRFGPNPPNTCQFWFYPLGTACQCGNFRGQVSPG